MTQKIKQNGFISKRSQVKKVLRDNILQGQYALGTKMESERELVDRFKVSRIVVRQALKELELERLIIRQQGRGTFVSSPLHTRDAEQTKIGMVGVLVPDVSYAYDRTVRGASTTAASHAYSVATSCYHYHYQSPRNELDNVMAFIQNGIVGVLIVPSSLESNACYETFMEHQTPVVFIDSIPKRCVEDYVKPDNHQGTSIATEHLIDLGHRKIAYVSHAPSDANFAPGVCERLQGFLDTMKLNSLGVNPDWIISQEADQISSKTLEILQSHNRPTAFLAYNDAWAIRIILACRKIGLRVPEDVSVVGFDNSELPSQYDIPLTTIEPEHYEMGVSATELLLKKIEDPQPRSKRGILITPHLVQKNSTQRLVL